VAEPSDREAESGRAGGADAVLPVTVGTAAWAVALLVLLLLRERLRTAGDGWWIWVAATGLTLGVLGSVWVRRRRAAYRRDRG
jgi:hypothetical protein